MPTIECRQGLRIVYFFRKRFALAIARVCQGASSAAKDTLPPLATSRDADLAAASAFSLTMRWYSAGEQSFCIIRRVRRVIVSQDASVKSVIIIASDNLLRYLRVLMAYALSGKHNGSTLRDRACSG